jgi:hypothetical protein
MGAVEMGLPDLIGALLGFFLTLMVFSYIFGDNALFRLVIHIFIGVAAGYAAVVAVYNVIWPQLVLPLVSGSRSERLFVLFPLVLSGLLAFRVSPRLARIGAPSIAYLVGVGVATTIGGALLGTLFPQVGASINLFDMELARQGNQATWLRLVEGGLVLIGTVTTLLYFHFSVRSKSGARSETGAQPAQWVEAVGWIGQLFIAVTLGVIFAGVLSAALAALIERVSFLVDFLFTLLLPK